MRDAVVFLCMLKDHYVVGACITAYTHKVLMMANNITNIELVVMCDDHIYKRYRSTLRYYFDRVVRIDLLHFETIDMEKFFAGRDKKYSSWINYSPNKWQCMKLTEYRKVLFSDIDILPVSHKFYNIFDLDTPAFRLAQNGNVEKIKCKNNDHIKGLLDRYQSDRNNDYNQYLKKVGNNFYSLDGGIVLLKPNMNEYEEYIDQMNRLVEQYRGIYQVQKSGIDETTLFFYYAKHKPQKEFYRSCEEFALIPWDSDPTDVKKCYAYNYLSYVKPWRKPKFISWNEEMLWGDIYRRMTKTTKLKKLYMQTIVDGLEEYRQYNDQPVLQKRYYNNQYKYKNPKLFENLSGKTYEQIVRMENEQFPKSLKRSYGSLDGDKIKKMFKDIKLYKLLVKKNNRTNHTISGSV